MSTDDREAVGERLASLIDQFTSADLDALGD